MRVQVRKIGVKRLIRDEKGYILILALLVLVVVGLISGPVLSYMVSGLRAGHVFETGAAELYAADGGVTYGLWKIKSSGLCPGNLPVDYSVNLNDRDVEVTIEYEGGPYKITSNATTATNSHTTVVSYVDVTFRSFLDNAITSSDDITIFPGVTVNGTVQYGGELSGGGNVTGQTINELYTKWPSYGALCTYYNVSSLPTLALDNVAKEEIDVKNHATISGRRDGNLNIVNTGGNRTLGLDGTLYVTGNLVFQVTGNDPYTVDLGGRTILVGGTITFPSQRVSISGSGCIIAVGSIAFLPGMQSDPSDFVLLMSLTDDVTLLPSTGTFYGSIAGSSVEADIDLKANVVWQPIPEGGIDFPIDGYEMVNTATISTWEVYRQ
jgi:hypothetical protein